MATRRAAQVAAEAPADLQRKRPALVAAAVDDGDTDADRMAAEVETEEEADDGSVLVTLVTDRGEADIRVPPVGRWRSMARAALFTRGDDLTWASLTLSPGDARTWAELDPTKDDSDEFFTEWGRATGERLGESQHSNRASRRSRRR